METKTQETIDLVFIMDRSGSMSGSEKDTIGGFNSFIKRQKQKDENTFVTTVLFDDKYEVLYKRKPITEVDELTGEEYWVRGCTALLDAIGKTITTLDRQVENKVLFVIMTDGYENASREYSKEQIKSLINNHNWEFIYIGADIDSYGEAGRFGLRKSRVANYKKSARGVEKMYTSIDCAVDCMRSNRNLDDVNWKEDLEEFD